VTYKVDSTELVTKTRQVVSLSEQMLNMAHQSQWRLFEKTEKIRQQLLTQIFEHDSITEILPTIASFLQQILDYDNESIQLGEFARSETLQELSTIHSNVHAVSAYQQLSSLEQLK